METDAVANFVAERVKKGLGAREVQLKERVQSLWSGYGAIYRASVVGLAGSSEQANVIVKHVNPPNDAKHPRGWSSDVSHERKLRSYRVEREFYASFAKAQGPECRVPQASFLAEGAGDWLFVLEDLDAAGFSVRKHSLNEAQMRHCLKWLAEFHATHLGVAPQGLWTTGSYWHLETRPDELAVLTDVALREAAPALDEHLEKARFQTLVHGDAKVANFCFPKERDADQRVAAVDFQYVGGGCGMKDVAYFFSSCLDEFQCEEQAAHWLDEYFSYLRAALDERGRSAVSEDLEAEWRRLYPLAWADFVRFLLGWAPEHFKLHGYSRRMTTEALQSLR